MARQAGEPGTSAPARRPSKDLPGPMAGGATRPDWCIALPITVETQAEGSKGGGGARAGVAGGAGRGGFEALSYPGVLWRRKSTARWGRGSEGGDPLGALGSGKESLGYSEQRRGGWGRGCHGRRRRRQRPKGPDRTPRSALGHLLSRQHGKAGNQGEGATELEAPMPQGDSEEQPAHP